MDVRVFQKTKVQNKRWYVLNMILPQVATFPYVIGNVMMLLGCTSGFYLIAVGVVASFVKVFSTPGSFWSRLIIEVDV